MNHNNPHYGDHDGRDGLYLHLREDALLHVAKAMGPKYMDIAAKRLGNMVVLADAAYSQLAAIPASRHRGPDGLIAPDLLDLTKLGLTREEVVARQTELAQLIAPAPAPEPVAPPPQPQVDGASISLEEQLQHHPIGHARCL